MRALGAFLVLAWAAAPRLAAQASIRVMLGARYSSTLVHDSIVTPLDVRADLAPAASGALALPLQGPWRLEVIADLSTSPVESHDASGATQRITRVWTIAVGLGLSRRLNPWLESRAALGGLKHLPASAVGLFRNGGGGLAPFGSLAFDAFPAVLARRRLALELMGDMHRFLTPALRSAGFADSRVVYRVTAGVRANLWTAR